MKRKFALLVLLFTSFTSYSQIIFEEGYFVTNKGEKVNCLIKNIDWKNNPTEFVYKLSENSDLQKADIDGINIFSIKNGAKYQRFTLNIDRSGNYLRLLDYNREPVFNKEQLFLKVLVEGKASLYEYTFQDFSKFFYRVDSAHVEQLFYKLYKVSDFAIKTNEQYKQQLWVNLKCDNLSKSLFEKADYNGNSLIKIFEKYNECIGSEFISYKKRTSEDLFNFSLRPGFYYTSLFVKNNYFGAISRSDVNFGYESGLRFGVEAEFILPFNKNKWSIVIEPNYKNFQSKGIAQDELGDINVTVNYKSIELPVGVRHYFFINEKNKVFFNSLIAYDYAFDSEIEFLTRGVILEIKSRINFAYGIGYCHNNKFSLEARHQLKREILSNYVSWRSNYSGFAFILGYTVF